MNPKLTGKKKKIFDRRYCIVSSVCRKVCNCTILH